MPPSAGRDRLGGMANDQTPASPCRWRAARSGLGTVAVGAVLDQEDPVAAAVGGDLVGLGTRQRPPMWTRKAAFGLCASAFASEVGCKRHAEVVAVAILTLDLAAGAGMTESGVAMKGSFWTGRGRSRRQEPPGTRAPPTRAAPDLQGRGTRRDGGAVPVLPRGLELDGQLALETSAPRRRSDPRGREAGLDLCDRSRSQSARCRARPCREPRAGTSPAAAAAVRINRGRGGSLA